MDGAIWQSMDMGYEFVDDFESADPLLGDTWKKYDTGMTNIDVIKEDGAAIINGTHPYLSGWRYLGMDLNRTIEGSFEISADIWFEKGVYRTPRSYFYLRLYDQDGHYIEIMADGDGRTYQMRNDVTGGLITGGVLYFDGFEPDRYHTWSLRYDATSRTLEGLIDGQLIDRFQYMDLEYVWPRLFFQSYYTDKTVRIRIDNFHTTPFVSIPATALETELKVQIAHKGMGGAAHRTVIQSVYADGTGPQVSVLSPPSHGYASESTRIIAHVNDAFSMTGGTLSYVDPSGSSGDVPLVLDTDSAFEKRLLWLRGGGTSRPDTQAMDWTFDPMPTSDAGVYNRLRDLGDYSVVMMSELYSTSFAMGNPDVQSELMEWVLNGGSLYILYPAGTSGIYDMLGVEYHQDNGDGLVVQDPEHPMMSYPYPAVTQGWPGTYEALGYWLDYADDGFEPIITHPDVPAGAVTMVKHHGKGLIIMDASYSSRSYGQVIADWVVVNALSYIQRNRLAQLGVSSTAAAVQSTDHAMEDYFDNIFTYRQPGAAAVSVHFSRIDMEDGYDFVQVLDRQGRPLQTLTGSHTDLWTTVVPGDTLHLRAITDGSIRSWGFDTDLLRHYGSWVADIPAIGVPGTLTYSIGATDGAGNTGTSPSYTLELAEPPVVMNVTTSPDRPGSSDAITVEAEVMDTVLRADTAAELLGGTYANLTFDDEGGLRLDRTVNATDRYFAGNDDGNVYMLEIGESLTVLNITLVAHFNAAVRGLIAADFDEDGDVDLMVMNRTDGYLYLIEQTGDWTFADPVSTGVDAGGLNYHDYGFETGDFNEDGHLDIVGGGYQKYVRLFTGHGNGTFDVTVLGSLASDLTGMATGDINNDGHLDFMVGTLSGNLISFLGHGNGTFTRVTSVDPTPGTSNSGKSLILEDFDGDGNLDILVNTGNLWFHKGRGDGVNFTYSGVVGDTSYWGEMDVVDMDGDGDLDLLTASYARYGVLTFRNSGIIRGAPVFSLVQTYQITYPRYCLGFAKSQYSYVPSGSATSAVRDMGSAVEWRYIQLEHSSGNGQTMDLEVRTSADNSSWTAWVHVFPGGAPGEGPVSTWAFPGGPTARYVQWRITMEDASLTATPYLRSINMLGTTVDPSVQLKWRRPSASELVPWSTATMSKVSPGRYAGSIPAPPVGPNGFLSVSVVATSTGGLKGDAGTRAFRDAAGPVLIGAHVLPYYSNTTTAVRIVADLVDSSGVANATLHYSFDNSTWSSLPMGLGYDRSTDMDGDADHELAVAIETSGTLLVLDADLSTNWSMTGLGGSQPKPMKSGDIDGDGLPELVVGDPRNDPTAFWVLEYNASAGAYQVAYTHVASSNNQVYALEIADVDGDGSLEVLRSLLTGECVVSSWNGISFSDTDTFWLAYNPVVIRALDWDGDGVVEIISADRTTTGNIRVYSWNGSAFVSEWASGDLGDTVYGLAIADMDGDGTLDLVCGYENFYSSYHGILYMISPDGPDSYHVVWRGEYPGYLVYIYDAADWDGDGRIEVAVGHYNIRDYPTGTFAMTFEWDPETCSLVLDWTSDGHSSIYSGHARFMDLVGDSGLELVVPSNEGVIYAYGPTSRYPIARSTDLGSNAGVVYPGALTPLGSPDTWSATIPAAGSDTQVWYYIEATDSSGESSTTRTMTYYADATAPTIDDVTSPPAYLRAQDPLEIYSNVTDSVSIGGARLEYNITGGTWESIVMTRLSTGGTMQFMATIPAIGSATTVSFRVVAWDIAGNTRTSPTQSYVVNPGPVFNWMNDGFGSPFKWELNITDDGSVTSVTITYSTDRVTWYNATVSQTGDIYSASADLDANSTVYFEVRATDDLGLTNSFRGRSGDSNVTMLVAEPLALTSEEQQIFQLLHDQYYTISVMDDDEASVTNLTSTDLVVVVDDGRISSSLVTALVDDGVSVLLLGDAMRIVATSGWYWYANNDYRTLNVVADEEPFRAYYRMSTIILSGGAGGRITSVPSGWTLVASISVSSYYSVIKMENATSGGRAITFPYEVMYLNDRGWHFFIQLMNWTLGEPLDGEVHAKADHVVLAIENEDGTLSARDSRVNGLLVGWGYDVQTLRPRDQSRFNATNATAVVVPAYYGTYGVNSHVWNRFLTQGVPVILLRDAIYPYKTNNWAGGTGYYYGATVILDAWFVTGYNGTRFYRQNSGYGYAYYNSGPSGWTALGYMDSYGNYYNQWYKQASSGALAFADMSDPLYYQPDGEFLLWRMLQNATGVAMPGEATVPSGSVVMVIAGGVGGSGPGLTAEESVVSDLLTSWGHTIYYLPQMNMTRTNVSGAKAVVATHWVDTNTASSTFFDNALSMGIGVVLCYDAGRTYGNSWYYSTNWEYQYARVMNTTTIFEHHSSINFYYQDGGTGVRVPVTCSGWTMLASSGNTYYSTWQQKAGPNGTYAFIAGLNPSYINLNGIYFLELAVNFSMGIAVPSISVVPTDDVVFITYGEDIDGPVLNDHETPVADELTRWGYSITYVHQRDLLTLDFTNASMIVAADYIRDYRAWDTVLDSAVDANIGVVLVWRGSYAYQTSWGAYDQWQRRLYYVESPTAFYEGMSGYAFYAQDSGAGYYWGNTYTGFTRIGRDYYNSGTAFYKEGASDAHVCVLTVDPITMRPISLLERMFNFSQNISIAKIPTSADAVLLVADTTVIDPVPTAREAYLRDFLEQMGLTVELRTWLEARRYDLSSSQLVTYVEDLGIGTDTHTKYIDEGVGLALFYTGGISSGSNWYSQAANSDSWYALTCSPGGGYLDGYTGISVKVLDEPHTIWRSSGTPPGWTFAGYTYYNSGYRIAHWRENTTSGGHGAILGYDLNHLTGDGREVARAMIDWCLDGSVDQRVVSDGNAVLVIRSSEANPTLTDLESAARDLIVANGLEVAYVPLSHVGTTDLSRAVGIFVVEGYIEPTLVNRWVSIGYHVGLMYTGSDDFGGSWTWHNHANTRTYTATGADGFNHMFADTQFLAEKADSVYCMYANFPAGSVRDGHGYYTSYWTGAHRVDSSSGGRVGFLTFDPRDLTMAGEALYGNLIAWVTGLPYPMQNSTSGKVAFVVNSYDESGTSLSTREQALADNLTAMGLSIEYVSHVNSSRTDFSRSLFVVFCDYAPARYLVDHLIDDLGKGVGLYYTSAWRHGGSNGWPNGASANTFYILDNSSFMANYSSSTAITVVNPGISQFEIYNYVPSGWTWVGYMTWSSYYRTGYSRENSTTGGRGVIFTYRPDYLNSVGIDVLNETFYYLRGANKNMPDGNADLTVTSVAIDAGSYSAGDTVTVNATVKNQGTSDVNRSFSVVYTLDGRTMGAVVLANLSAGASINISYNWTVLPGTHVIGVVADPNGLVPESNEGNNGRMLTVADVAGPDLTIETVTVQPVPSEDGNFINVTVTVANVGTVDATNDIEVMVLNGTRGLGSVFIQGIAGGKNATVTLIVLGLVATANMTVYADWGDRTLETDETNNTYTLAGSIVPPAGQTIQAKKGTWVQIEMTTVGWTSESTAVTARLSDPLDNNVQTQSYSASSWGTRTMEYLLDDSGTWELTVEFGHTAYDYTILVTVVDPTTGLETVYTYAHRVGTGITGSRTYAIVVPAAAGWYFGPNQSVSAKEGTWINVTVETLEYVTGNNDVYVAIVDSRGIVADEFAYGDVSGWGSRTITALADVNGTWTVDVWCVGAYWRFNLTLEVTDPTSGLRTSYWHHGATGTWIQEGNTRSYHLDVPTNNDFHLRLDTVVKAEGGTWFNMTFNSRHGHTNGYLDTYLLNATGNPVHRYYLNQISYTWDPRTYRYLLDEPGNWTFSIYSNVWTVSYTITLSWVDQDTGLRREATHHGVTGTWVGRRDYTINVSAPSTKPFTYDETVYLGTGDLVTVSLRTGSYYSSGHYIDLRFVNSDGFLVDQRYLRNPDFAGTISFTNEIYNPGKWYIAIGTDGYWSHYYLDITVTDGTTGTNTTYTHHGSTSIWNSPNSWRYYHINATGAPTEQPFNPGEEAAALMGTRMALQVQGGSYTSYSEYCYVRLYNPDGRTSASLVRRADDWSPHELNYIFDMPGMWTLEFHSNQPAWKYYMALQLTDPVANSTYWLNSSLALGTVTSSTHTFYINVTEVPEWVMGYGFTQLVLDVGDAVFVDMEILEYSLAGGNGEMMFVCYQGEVVNEYDYRWKPVELVSNLHWKYTHERGTNFYVVIGYEHYAMHYHLQMRIWKSQTNTWEYLEHYGSAGWYSWEPLVDYTINATTYVPPTPPPTVDVGDVECVSEPLRRWAANVVPSWAFEVAPGPLNGVDVPFYITPPPGTTPGQYHFLVRVRSVTNGYVTATAMAIVNVTAYGAHVAVSPDLVTVDPGEVASYRVTINNTGLVRTTFDLRTAVVFGNFSQPNVTLDPGESITVDLFVEGNTTSFLPYGVHNMGVMAIPQPEPSIYGIAWTSVGINKAEGLDASADPTLLRIARPGLTDGYTVMVSNTGNIDQDVTFDLVADPSVVWHFGVPAAHLGALMDKEVFLFITGTKEGSFPLTIRVICTSNASLSVSINVTLQIGFRMTDLTLTDGTGVYTDTGTLHIHIVDEIGETLLYPPNKFVFEYRDGGAWVPLLPGEYSLSSGTDADVTFDTPDIKPGDYPLRARYLGSGHYNASQDVGVLHVLKETPVPQPTNTRVQYTDYTAIAYTVLDDDGQPVTVDVSKLRLLYKGTDGSWHDLHATFTGASPNTGTASFEAPPAPAGTYEMQMVYDGDDYYDVGNGTGTLDVVLEVTGVTYTGDTSGPYGGTATLSCYLEDADNSTAIEGAEVNFTLNGVRYSATTDATGQAGVTISVTAPPGTYQVVVTYSGNASFKPSTDSAQFIVVDVNAPTADAGSDATIDEDTIFRFDGSGSSDDDPNFPASSTFEWTLTDGGQTITLYGVRPYYVFSTPGVYVVTLNVTDSGGNSGLDTVTITVRDVTRPRADAGPDQVVDEDTQVTFDASGTWDNDPGFASSATYEWTFEDQGAPITLTGLGPTYTFSTPGRYVVTMTATDAAGNSDTDDMVVLVLDVTPPMADAGSDQTVDEDTYVPFDGTGSTDNHPDFPKGADFEWTFEVNEVLYRVTGRSSGFVFNTPGVYNVTLTVTDEAGNQGTDNVIFTVLDTTPPVARAGDDLTVNEDATITLDGSASTDNDPEFPLGADHRWTWTEDGTPMSLQGEIVQHSFATPGRYEVTLTVTDAGGNSATDVIVVTVRDITAPVPVADDLEVDEDVPVSFDGTGTTDNSPAFPLGASFLWTFEDRGRTVNLFGQTPLYIFRDPGVYDVTLTVRDAAGNSASINVTVTVADLTAPEAEAGPDVVVDQGAEATFNGSGSSDNHVDFPEGATFTWVVEDFDGTFTHVGLEATHPFETVGSYKVTLRVRDAAGNEDTDTLTVHVRDTEAPTALAVTLSAVDEDEVVTVNLKPFLSDNDPRFFETANVEWDLTDPWGEHISADGLSPTLQFETPGLWNASVVVADAAGNSITVEFDIFVNDVTAPVVSVETPGAFADEDVEVTFDASATTDNNPDWDEGASFSWSWEPARAGDSGDVGSADGAVLDVTFETPGTYQVSLTVSDAAGNSAGWEGLIEVLDVTGPDVDVGDDRTVDEDTLVFFEVTVTDNHPLFPTGAETYTWTIEDAAGTEWELYGIRPSFTFAEPGAYTVTCLVLDSWGNSGSDSMTVNVTDTTPPGGVKDLVVDDKGLGKVVLEWSPTTDPDVAGFRIYRRQGADGTWELVAELGPSATSYTDEEVEPGKTYRYRVEAFDEDGNEGPPVEQSHDTESPEEEGVFPWWLIVVAFIAGLAVAFVIGEARLRKQKGDEEDETTLPSDEDTLEAVEMDEDLEEVDPDEIEGETHDEASSLSAVTLEEMAEMDTHEVSGWEETR